MIRRLFLMAWLLVLPVAPALATVGAADLLDAKVDYSADFYLLSAGQGTYKGTVIHAPGRERREYDTRHGRQALILRRDIDQAMMVWPERKWYVMTSFDGIASLVGGSDLQIDRRADGRETISGEACTRWRVNGTGGDGAAVQAILWLTRDGIPMKAKGTVTFGGRKTRFETGLLNLRRIKADPAAFTLPSDYRGVPLNLSTLKLR